LGGEAHIWVGQIMGAGRGKCVLVLKHARSCTVENTDVQWQWLHRTLAIRMVSYKTTTASLDCCRTVRMYTPWLCPSHRGQQQ
jgi:hypothetical protein